MLLPLLLNHGQIISQSYDQVNHQEKTYHLVPDEQNSHTQDHHPLATHLEQIQIRELEVADLCILYQSEGNEMLTVLTILKMIIALKASVQETYLEVQLLLSTQILLVS